MTILRIALDVPLPQLYDYREPPSAKARPVEIGCRVLVPFGRRRLVGVVVETARESEIPAERLRSAYGVLSDTPPLPGHWLALARFAAAYYQRPLGEVIHAALPPRLRRPEPLKAEAEAWAITDAGQALLASLPSRRTHRRALLEHLATSSPATPNDLPLATDAARAALRALVAEGAIAACDLMPITSAPQERVPLTDAQQAAFDAVVASRDRFQAFLLHGVTGSGKTEVYLRLASEAVRSGRQVLILVPEINLTPQLEATFRAVFPAQTLVTLTSAAADNIRALNWIAAMTGRARVVLGTRLAVFTPLPELGLVVVDEEQDASFKQQEGLRYSARDLAVYRAHAAGCPVVLGTATPSLETWWNAQSGRYRLLSMPERARAGAVLPAVRLIDTRAEPPSKDGLSDTIVRAIEACLARGEQALVFLNRRGYAPVLACNACGWAAGCVRCAAHLVVHLGERRLRCHHCGHVEGIPRVCPTCGNVDLMPFGRGTQKLEATLIERFPGARVLRVDSDSTRAKGRFNEMTEAIRSGRADILVGTQMLAKGHDFPGVTLVVVLNTDAGLVSSDYRGPERLFQQLEQVAGRAGRADRPGEVLVQTRFPRHPLYQALIEHDYPRFAAAALEERQVAGFPPFVHEAVLRAESETLEHANAFLRTAIRSAPPRPEGMHLYDPVPMTLARLAGRERAQVLVQSSSRSVLQSFLQQWATALHAINARDVRWHIDVDPLEF